MPESPAPHPAVTDDPGDLPGRVDALIVGVGFGGLAALHRLRTDHPQLTTLAIERAEGAGGVWRDNEYPGAACDVPTSLYSLSFAPNPDWGHTYGRQHEIHRYLRAVADDFADTIVYDCTLLGADWRADQGEWEVTTSRGSLRCRFLIAAPGALSEPVVPTVDGLDSFSGNVFHSARWDHTVSLAGRRVAVIGSGASAVQIVPEIVDRVAELTLFQRTPAWVLPRLDRTIGPLERALYRRFPAAHRLVRFAVYAYRESYVTVLARHPRLLPLPTLVARAQLRLQVRDRRLRKRLTPGFTIGCKRILLTNKWFPALARDNVTVTSALARFTPDGVVDADGTEHRVDTVVFATGFTPTQPPIAEVIRGRDGVTLAQTWAGSPRAYRGIEIHGFPNLFFMYGPNTNLGHSSIVLMLEPQAHHIGAAITRLTRLGKGVVEVTAEAQEHYNHDLDDQLATTVWNTGGCASWYLDSTGRNSVMWPTYTHVYRKLMSDFVDADHHIYAGQGVAPEHTTSQGRTDIRSSGTMSG